MYKFAIVDHIVNVYIIAGYHFKSCIVEVYFWFGFAIFFDDTPNFEG